VLEIFIVLIQTIIIKNALDAYRGKGNGSDYYLILPTESAHNLNCEFKGIELFNLGY